MEVKVKRQKREKRKRRIRKSVSGTKQTPRISVFRSNKHIYAQAIDDVNSITLASANDKNEKAKKSEKAEKVGESLGKKLKDMKIKKAVFDRSGYKYHGRVKQLAEGIRKTGIKF
jgi:large subunit ribosomal protein L18